MVRRYCFRNRLTVSIFFSGNMTYRASRSTRRGAGVRSTLRPRTDIIMGKRKSADHTDHGHLRARARQAARLAAVRGALIAAGYETTAKQARALGVCRSTAWVVLNRDDRAGPSAMMLKRILSSPKLPFSARRKIEQYFFEKIADRIGHRAN